MNAITPYAPTIPVGVVVGSTVSIFGRLNLEWAALRNDAAANARAATWAAADPALAGLSTLALIEAAKKGPVGRVDMMFGALVRRAVGRGRDAELAARIVLQLMLPRAAALTGMYRSVVGDPEERAQLAVTCMYTAIREHPRRVRRYIPPHLGWSAHHLMGREVSGRFKEKPVDDVDTLVSRYGGALLVSSMRRMVGSNGVDDRSSQLHASEELARVLAWAVAKRVISERDACLLAARYGSETPSNTSWKSIGDLKEIARGTGLTPDALKKRCSRATARLSTVIGGYTPGVTR